MPILFACCRDVIGRGCAPGKASRFAGGLLIVLTASCGPSSSWPGLTRLATATASAPAESATEATTRRTPLPPDATGPGEQGAKPAVLVTQFTFDVLRARVPAGFFSQSGKVWNHLETEVLPAETVRLLHRNGLRVGRGKTAGWPPIKALLETEARVQVSQNRLTVHNGYPLLLELDQQPKDQLLFVYRRDGTMAGAPWKSSTNLLRIEYGVSPASADAVRVVVMPELRLDSAAANEPRGVERWIPGGPNPPSMALRELAFQMELARGDFVAVGPSATAGELPYVVGSLMLRDETAGEKFESMYFLTPTVTRSTSVLPRPENAEPSS